MIEWTMSPAWIPTAMAYALAVAVLVWRYRMKATDDREMKALWKRIEALERGSAEDIDRLNQLERGMFMLVRTTPTGPWELRLNTGVEWAQIGDGATAREAIDDAFQR